MGRSSQRAFRTSGRNARRGRLPGLSGLPAFRLLRKGRHDAELKWHRRLGVYHRRRIPSGRRFFGAGHSDTKRFVRCFWGLDKSLAYARHFPAIHWLTSYSEYLGDLAHWYSKNVSPKFVDDRNQLMAILNSESSLMEIVKLIGSDVLPDDQKLTLEIARVIRLGFLQQNAFHPDDTCVSLEKQFKMMEVILYLNQKCKILVGMGMPVSILKRENIFEKVISIKYDVPNDHLEMMDDYMKAIDDFYNTVMEKNG